MCSLVFFKKCRNNCYFVAAASTVRYSIVDGNTYNAFLIEDLTGKIRVNSPLDYENITSVSNNAKHNKYCFIHIMHLKMSK
jgi:hypothetical protein